MAGRIRPEVLSRKDKATTFTRKLIFEDALDADVRPYSEVTDAILAEPCFAVEDDTRIIANTLRSLTASNHSPTPLHVSLHMGQVIELDTSRLLQKANSKPVWFEIFDMPRSDHIWWNAFLSRCVIRISADGWVRSRRADHGPDRILLAEVLNRFVTTYSMDPRPGRLYICVTPELRLLAGQPQDFETGPLDAARTAVYDALYIVSRRTGRLVGWSNEQKAACFDSVIEFVAPGFQPPFPSDITRSVTLFNPHRIQADIPVVKPNESRDSWISAEAIMRRM